MDNQTLTWVIVALAAVAVVVIAVIASRRRAHRRSAELREHFGPEYDRAVAEHGDSKRAERELLARAERVERIQIRELNAADRARYHSAWTDIQARFVDDPALAVSDANELIGRVMRARGYPTENFEQRVADLSVDHPLVVQHYRAARSLAASSGGAQLNTEDLRQAMVHYRFLFTDLLQEPEPLSRMRESHA
ncbi:MAG: hypothetical protein ABJB12_04205 [Pseudomonadota bacterium]